MGIKKIARPINKAKNEFVKWLKKKEAEDIDIYEGASAPEWDYYRVVSGFIGENLVTVGFHMWRSKISIDYSDDENRYNEMTIEKFMELIKD